MDAKLAKEHKPDPFEFEYTTRDAIIYALGIGCKAKEDLRYIYEGAEGFIPLPTYVVAPGLLANMILDWPGIQFDLTRILHGDQYIELYAPLPSEGSLRSETRVVDVLDKGSGALIMSEITTYDAHSGKKLAMQQFGTFQVGSGNFGGARTSPHEKKGADIPKRPADKILSDTTSVDQAALYRMGSGDLNPLHVDPEFATMSGFKTPILHGLCSMGFATRHVLKAFANNDATLFKAMKVRFTSPVLPGQTLETHMWDEGDRVVFETKVKETGKTVVSNGYMLLHGKTGRGQAKL
ncbi:maoc-1 [Pristionchus pacificus]|uniref:Maoc-1 n=1 Tax=Pristionchus pacificus TaxID=54126 RepID=A0A454Y674_PRIPA|nr:maoc-1 [Pristionchus pacificus]|eukprot:PDM82304.1 maoc-1 [Pristionchus pacificus]